MLKVWLQSSPNPTWSELVETLRSPDINRPDIAAMIEDVYIKSDDSSLQENKDTAGEYCVTNYYVVVYKTTWYTLIGFNCYNFSAESISTPIGADPILFEVGGRGLSNPLGNAHQSIASRFIPYIACNFRGAKYSWFSWLEV